MAQTLAKPKAKKLIRLSKLDLETEDRLMKMLIKEMKADGEAPTAESLRAEGLSEAFIKRFLSVWVEQSA